MQRVACRCRRRRRQERQSHHFACLFFLFNFICMYIAAETKRAVRRLCQKTKLKSLKSGCGRNINCSHAVSVYITDRNTCINHRPDVCWVHEPCCLAVIRMLLIHLNICTLMVCSVSPGRTATAAAATCLVLSSCFSVYQLFSHR